MWLKALQKRKSLEKECFNWERIESKFLYLGQTLRKENKKQNKKTFFQVMEWIFNHATQYGFRMFCQQNWKYGYYQNFELFSRSSGTFFDERSANHR